MLVCDKCGTKIPDGSKFCPECADPVTELDIVETKEVTTSSSDSTKIDVICPQCETQFLINYDHKQNTISHSCPECSTVSESQFVQIRSKRSKGSKKDNKREFTVRVFLPEGGEKLIEFVNASYDDIELRSKDYALFTYLNGQLKIILNYKINRYTVISKPSCYIATYIFENQSEEVELLRDYRDFVLLRTQVTKLVVNFYYFISPQLIRYFGNSEFFKNTSRHILLNLISIIQKKD